MAIVIPSPPPSRPNTSGWAASTADSGFDEGRFPPGTLLSERYRIIGRLGKGGMGEVYRANDVRLGQTVALKFLPESMSQDPAVLARFHNEVRVARQVTHPNVCRVYDIGEAEGQAFISMEYIDGEDLSVLLRRIGRLSADKAVEIARKLCAGLAAAHTQGVLHRDLKPANIMIDGRGQILITDFGLAGLADQMRGVEVRNGTPAYMAPEQLTGREVSAKSDIYALGLVLYEIFTGKPPFQAQTMAEMVRLREHAKPASPSSVVHDIDPTVERIILKCLEADPRNRPSSAIAVAAALPGGDPLAAALAAGETPSPEMVAAAGETEGMRPRDAALAFGGILLGLIAVLILFAQSSLERLIDFDLPPEALAVKARDVTRALGYAQAPLDRVYGLDLAYHRLDYLNKDPKSANRWPLLVNARPGSAVFWYRQSPRHLIANGPRGLVDMSDPPLDVSGMVNLMLDPAGRLYSFQAVPQQFEAAAQPAVPLNPGPIFAAAGIDPARFSPAEPQWAPPVACDSRAAWTGSFAEAPGVPIRLEAASWRGKPVFFKIVGPWTEPESMPLKQSTASEKVAQGASLGIILMIVIGAAVMARYNALMGRGDRRGALRIGAFAFSLYVAGWFLLAHHIADIPEVFLILEAVAFGLATGALMWLFYLALEPHVRRRWPQTLIAWSRLLSGRVRDPLVGREVLFGVLFAIGWGVLGGTRNWIGFRRGEAPKWGGKLDALLGTRFVAGNLLQPALQALTLALGFFLFIFLLRLALRKQWIAACAFVIIGGGQQALRSNNLAVDVPLTFAIYALLVVILMRFGVLALAVCIFVTNSLPSVLTTDLSAWYGSGSLGVVLMVVALGAWGFHTALGGRPVFGDVLLRE